MDETTTMPDGLTVDSLVPGDQVTVTLTEGDVQQTFHGRVGTHYRAATIGTARGAYAHSRREGATARDWITITPMISRAFAPTVRFPMNAKDWEFGIVSMGVCLDSDAVQVEYLAEEGREWLRRNECESDKRDRLIARFAEFDGPAAEALDELISVMLIDAREDGMLAQRETSGY